MPADRLQPVRAQFGEPLPEGLRALSAEDLRDLAATLADAHAEQTGALDAAIDHTLRYLPWPLSAVVRRVLIG